MGTIAEKLSYLADTKDLFKDRLNSLGAEITSSTTFRNYLTWLDTFYGEVSDKTDLSQNGVVGRTSQESTTGKNLLNYTGIYSSGQGLTNTLASDGTITTTGVPSKNYAEILPVVDIKDLLEDNTTYTLSQETNNDYFFAQLNIHTAGGSYSYHNTKSSAYTFTTDFSTYDKYEITLQTTTTSEWGSDSRTISNRFQLEEGPTATAIEKFTYGASPNPSYPQPVNNLTGNVDYTIRGKNLWDYRAVPRSDNLTLHGITYVINDDGSITLNGTSTRQYIGLIYNITLPAGTYYIGGCPDGGSVRGYSVCVSWGNGTHIIVAPSKNAMQSFTLTEETTIQFWAVRIGGNTATFNNTVFYPMLYTVNDNNYDPYIEPKKVTIPLGDIELCNIDTYEDKIYSSNDRFYLYKETTKYNLFELPYIYSGSSTTPVDRTTLLVNNMGFKSTYLSNIVKSSLQNDSSIPNRVVTNMGTTGTWWLTLADNLTGINSSDDDTTKVSKIITYLQSKNAVLITYLATPTTTEITQENYPSLYNALKQIQDYLTAYKINKEFILGYSSPEIEY